MQLKQFETKNFEPRNEVLESGTKILDQELGSLSVDGTAKVVIADQGKSFLFSLVAGSKNKLYNLDVTYLKAETWGWPRDWQINAIMQMMKKFVFELSGKAKPTAEPATENDSTAES